MHFACWIYRHSYIPIRCGIGHELFSGVSPGDEIARSSSTLQVCTTQPWGAVPMRDEVVEPE
jgi:hypothetical protein